MVGCVCFILLLAGDAGWSFWFVCGFGCVLLLVIMLGLGRGVGPVVVDGGCWSCVWVGFGMMVTVLSIVGWYCCLLCWCFCLILGF